MKLIRTIQNKFRLSMLAAVGLTLVATTFLIVFETWQIGKTVAQSLAMLHAENVVKSIEKQIGKDIALSNYAANSEDLKAWLLDVSNEALKKEAFQMLMNMDQTVKESNTFVVADKDKSIYFTKAGMAYEAFKVSGYLSDAIKDDAWYFRSKSMEAPLSLNVDKDRFLSERKVWINAKVQDEGKTIGVVGMGINLNTVVSALANNYFGKGVKIVIVNEAGLVQLDNEMDRNRAYFQENEVYADQAIKDKQLVTAFEAYKKGKENFENKTKLITLKNGSFHYAAISRVENSNWYVITAYSLWTLVEAKYYLPILLWMVAEILVLGWVSTKLVSHHFVSPIGELVKSVELKEASGNYPIYGINRDDEFGKLAQSIEQMSERFVRAVPVGLFILDGNGRFTYVNPYFCNQFAYEDEMAFFTAFRQMPYAHFRNGKDFDHLKKDIEMGKKLISYELEFLDAKGIPFWAEIKLNLVEKNGERLQYEGMLLNIQHKKEYENRLINMAVTDPLTGLYNRHYLDKVIYEEASSSDRNGEALSMIIYDLDHFKKINDSFGHDVGDVVLIEVTNRVKRMLRKEEVLFRWGGEEFAVLLPKTTAPHAFEVAERLRKSIEDEPFEGVGQVTASFGVAERMAYEAYGEWFKRMDEALLKAKGNGRNQTQIATQGTVSHSLLKLIWKEEFISGHSIIDAQHHMLFELANQLMEACSKGESKEGIMTEYRNIAVHITKHLHDEIDILSELGYEEKQLKEHQLAHHELIEHMAQVSSRLEMGELSPTDALMKIIQEIIVDHMCHMDVAFYPFTRQVSSNGSDKVEKSLF